jgi:hypothetical protein
MTDSAFGDREADQDEVQRAAGWKQPGTSLMPREQQGNTGRCQREEDQEKQH